MPCRIKYTNLKDQLASGEIEEDMEDEEPMLPTNATLIPTVPVEVAVWSLGSYRLKGESRGARGSALSGSLLLMLKQLTGQSRLCARDCLPAG